MINWLRAKQLNNQEREELEALREVVSLIKERRATYNMLTYALTSPRNKSLREQAIFELKLFYSNLIYDIEEKLGKHG